MADRSGSWADAMRTEHRTGPLVQHDPAWARVMLHGPENVGAHDALMGYSPAWAQVMLHGPENVGAHDALMGYSPAWARVMLHGGRTLGRPDPPSP